MDMVSLVKSQAPVAKVLREKMGHAGHASLALEQLACALSPLKLLADMPDSRQHAIHVSSGDGLHVLRSDEDGNKYLENCSNSQYQKGLSAEVALLRSKLEALEGIGGGGCEDARAILRERIAELECCMTEDELWLARALEVCVCVHVRACVRVCARTCACVRACVRARARVRACVRACVCACVRARACVCVCPKP